MRCSGDAAKAERGQACSIRHKMATHLAVRAREIKVDGVVKVKLLSC